VGGFAGLAPFARFDEIRDKSRDPVEKEGIAHSDSIPLDLDEAGAVLRALVEHHRDGILAGLDEEITVAVGLIGCEFWVRGKLADAFFGGEIDGRGHGSHYKIMAGLVNDAARGAEQSTMSYLAEPRLGVYVEFLSPGNASHADAEMGRGASYAGDGLDGRGDNLPLLQQEGKGFDRREFRRDLEEVHNAKLGANSGFTLADLLDDALKHHGMD
jgi:hypothetical protein